MGTLESEVSEMQQRNAFGGFSSTEWSMKTVADFSEITPQVKDHLVKVYVTLMGTVLTAALGAAAFLFYGVGGSGLLSLVGIMGCLFTLNSTPPVSEQLQKRLALLGGIGFLMGNSVGPLLGATLHLDPSIAVNAFTGTVVVFGSFSASALYAKRRSWLYLGGMLGSALSTLMWLSLANMFFHSPALLNVQLYGGLLMFSGFVIFDTQMIVEKRSLGDEDFVKHACELFLDFMGIFVRLLIILSRN